MGPFGWQELLIVLVIIMIIFGAGKLPEVARSLGQGVKEFKKEASATEDSIPSSASDSAAAPTGERREQATVVETREMRAEEI